MTPTTFNPGKGAGSTVGIAILGYGTVGSQVLRLMVENADEFAHRTGGPLEVRGVAVSNKENTLAPSPTNWGFSPTTPAASSNATT